MDFAEKLKLLAAKSRETGSTLKTEEATKMALVAPLLSYLGYDIHDPREVCPEFICDVGEKKKERVDYAIMLDGKPAILIECKQYGGGLDITQGTQLERYFNTTFAKVAILTDGNRYRFFTDLDAANRMDKRPYMEFTLEAMDEALIGEIAKLAKGAFNPETAMIAATDLKYTREFRRLFDEQFSDPDEEFARFFIGKVCPGRRLTGPVKENFTVLLKKAMQRWLSGKINERLKNAMEKEEDTTVAEAIEAISETADDNRIETTDEEWQAFYLVKSLLVGVIPLERVFIRDTLSYCGVLFDDNNHKPICRFWFNGRQKYIGLLDNGDPTAKPRQEERVPITSLDDILPLADRIRETAKKYLQ